MKKRNENEEIQSRREFFKSAAKKALPILGVVALANMPIISKATETKDPATACQNYGCTMSCQSSCLGCTGECTGCTGGCTGYCTSCVAVCADSCTGGCEGSCLGSCVGGNQ